MTTTTTDEATARRSTRPAGDFTTYSPIGAYASLEIAVAAADDAARAAEAACRCDPTSTTRARALAAARRRAGRTQPPAPDRLSAGPAPGTSAAGSRQPGSPGCRRAPQPPAIGSARAEVRRHPGAQERKK